MLQEQGQQPCPARVQKCEGCQHGFSFPGASLSQGWAPLPAPPSPNQTKPNPVFSYFCSKSLPVCQKGMQQTPLCHKPTGKHPLLAPKELPCRRAARWAWDRERAGGPWKHQAWLPPCLQDASSSKEINNSINKNCWVRRRGRVPGPAWPIHLQLSLIGADLCSHFYHEHVQNKADI